MKLKSIGVGVLAGVLAASAAQATTTPYFLNLLLGQDGSMGTSAWGINDAGQVVGSQNVLQNTAAVLWSDPKTAEILHSTQPGDYASANAINGSGQVVGGVSGYVSSTFTSHAVSWVNGSAVSLAPLAGSTSSGASGINASGQVVGQSVTTIDNSEYPRATVWKNGKPTALAKLSGQQIGSSAVAINNVGQIAGDSITANGTVATIWQGTTVTALSNGTGIYSSAVAINDQGQVAGNVTNADRQTFAALWSGGQLTLLPALNGGNSSRAYGLNDLGQVVGYSVDSVTYQNHATLWNGTTAIDLNSFLSAQDIALGWVLTSATGINNKGYIIGSAYNSLTRDNVAYLLSDKSITPAPIPEPSTLALMCLGLVGMAAVARRQVSTPRC